MAFQSGFINFRIAKPEDSELVWKIVNISFQEYRDSDAPSSALMETSEHVRQAMSNGRERAVICYYEGKAAGTARFYFENGLYFRRLGVLPEFRGHGLSKAIISWLESFARSSGASRIWCNTRSSVERNMKLYEGMGYSLEENRTVERKGFEVGVATFSKSLDPIGEPSSFTRS